MVGLLFCGSKVKCQGHRVSKFILHTRTLHTRTAIHQHSLGGASSRRRRFEIGIECLLVSDCCGSSIFSDITCPKYYLLYPDTLCTLYTLRPLVVGVSKIAYHHSNISNTFSVLIVVIIVIVLYYSVE